MVEGTNCSIQPYCWGLKPYVSQNVPPGQSTYEWSQLQQFIPVVGKEIPSG
jgi:hypothetical protein